LRSTAHRICEESDVVVVAGLQNVCQEAGEEDGAAELEKEWPKFDIDYRRILAVASLGLEPVSEFFRRYLSHCRFSAREVVNG
jgi:hypothetical protein